MAAAVSAAVSARAERPLRHVAELLLAADAANQEQQQHVKAQWRISFCLPGHNCPISKRVSPRRALSFSNSRRATHHNEWNAHELQQLLALFVVFGQNLNQPP